MPESEDTNASRSDEAPSSASHDLQLGNEHKPLAPRSSSQAEHVPRYYGTVPLEGSADSSVTPL
jgi:hypothetical protein